MDKPRWGQAPVPLRIEKRKNIQKHHETHNFSKKQITTHYNFRIDFINEEIHFKITT